MNTFNFLIQPGISECINLFTDCLAQKGYEIDKVRPLWSK